jgi:hypothetical protein
MNLEALGRLGSRASKKIHILLHTSSVKTSMHRIGLLSFLRSIFAEKARAHREPYSTNSIFWLNSKVQNEIIII